MKKPTKMGNLLNNMKKVGLYLTLTFITYLIGQLVWYLSFISHEVYQKPLFGSEHLEGYQGTELILILIFTLSGIFGLISGVLLYKLEK